jgi:hypothetical protein
VGVEFEGVTREDYWDVQTSTFVSAATYALLESEWPVTKAKIQEALSSYVMVPSSTPGGDDGQPVEGWVGWLFS